MTDNLSREGLEALLAPGDHFKGLPYAEQQGLNCSLV